MALQLLIAGVDRISYLERNSLRINQDAATYVSTCYFNLIDPNNVITAAIKDTLVVEDPVLGEVYFDGTVANVDFDPLGGGSSPKRKVKIQCQDNNILVEEAVVVGPHTYVGVADNAIINALFLAYLPAIDSAVNVNLVDGAVTIDFQNISLREALRQLCDQTGAFWFVREDDLYYGVEADFGLVGWFLSDTPDNLNSFGYLRDTSRKFHGSNMVNEITVIGILDAAGGIIRQDLVSQGLYGVHAAITTDNRISTVAGANKRGDAILNEWSMPRESYTVKTMQGGAIAGQRIRYVNSVYGIDDTFTIRRLSISFPADTALYTMSLGDDLDLGLLGQRIFLDKIEEALEPITPGDLPLPSRGWAHDIVFSATDADTVIWAGGGTITTADGTAFAINAGTTLNMAPVTTRYIFLDIAVSLVNLQLADVAANAVGATRILIAVCYPNADAAKDAIFQVFGGEGQEVFVNADNIAANTITANEILANSITGGCLVVGTITALYIAALTITGTEIAADTITADKLQIGGMFFNDVDGLLLLGPHCEINTGEWISLRRQTATITGAFHQEAGRWIDTRGLVVEVETTNLCPNPSFEVDLTGWIVAGGDVMVQSSDYARFGDYSIKFTEGGGSHYIRYAGIVIGAPLNQGDDYTATGWVKAVGGSIGETARFRILEAGGVNPSASSYGTWLTLTGDWQQIIANHTIIEADRTSLYLYVYTSGFAVGEVLYVDGVQFEEADFATSYCDGSLGAGYVWTGATHLSTSTRAVTIVDLGEHTYLVNANDTMTFALWIQAPYDADDPDWPQASNYIFRAHEGAAPGSNFIIGYYSIATDIFRLGIDVGNVGTKNLSSSVQTFNAGDWIQLVYTIDFPADTMQVYINGVFDNNYTALTYAAPTLLDVWNLGSSGVISQGGWNFGEYAVFDKVLTAVEVAQLYNLQRPLVDAGAMNTPGIYIYDGRFRIASSITGNRIEITPEEIAGYDSAGVKQFYLQSSDGKAYAGAGAVILDDDGISIETGAGAPNTISWVNVGNSRGSIYVSYIVNSSHMYILSGPCAIAGNSEIHMEAMEAGGVGTGASIYLYSGGTGLIAMSLLGAEEFRITSTGFSTNVGAHRWQPRGYNAGVQVDTGYVNVKINGTDYKLLARL